MGEHELDQGLARDDRVGDDEEALAAGVVGRGGEVSGRADGGAEVLVAAEQAGDPADRVVGRDPEPAVLSLELALGEAVQIPGADDLGLGQPIELELAHPLDPVGDLRQRGDADPPKLRRVELGRRGRRLRGRLGRASGAGERERRGEREQDQQREPELRPAVHRCRV